MIAAISLKPTTSEIIKDDLSFKRYDAYSGGIMIEKVSG